MFSLAAAVIFFVAGWALLFVSDSDTIPWLGDIVDHLSYGWATDHGIHYRKWFRWRFVEWKQIETVEYWPERDGRIDLHLFPLISPVVFIPELSSAKESHARSTVDFISAKLSQTWPGKSPFLISFQSPCSAKISSTCRANAKSVVTGSAFALGFSMLLLTIASYGYWLIRDRYRYLWLYIAAICAGLWLVTASVRFVARRRSTSRANAKSVVTGSAFALGFSMLLLIVLSYGYWYIRQWHFGLLIAVIWAGVALVWALRLTRGRRMSSEKSETRLQTVRNEPGQNPRR